MARLIELKQTAPERFLARFDTGEELRTTLAVVTDFHLRSGKELTSPELDALRAASERSRCRQRALRIIGARAMSVKELTDRLKEKGESPENAEDAAAWLQELHLLDDAQYAAMCVRHYAAKGYGAGPSAASCTAAASRASCGTMRCRSCRSRTTKSTRCCAAACAATHPTATSCAARRTISTAAASGATRSARPSRAIRITLRSVDPCHIESA